MHQNPYNKKEKLERGSRFLIVDASGLSIYIWLVHPSWITQLGRANFVHDFSCPLSHPLHRTRKGSEGFTGRVIVNKRG